MTECNGNASYRANGKRGYCARHYYRFMRHGDPGAGRTPPLASLEWLIARVNFEGDECLIWPFATNNKGYGEVHYHGRQQSAHRVMCRLRHGEPTSPDLLATHSCGNGHLGCVNPNHLRWGDIALNSADMVRHGRSAKGSKNPAATLTDDDVREILRLKGKLRQREIADRFGVNRTAISRIHAGVRWGWLSEASAQ